MLVRGCCVCGKGEVEGGGGGCEGEDFGVVCVLHDCVLDGGNGDTEGGVNTQPAIEGFCQECVRGWGGCTALTEAGCEVVEGAGVTVYARVCVCVCVSHTCAATPLNRSASVTMSAARAMRA